jgi:hypothetical protein
MNPVYMEFMHVLMQHPGALPSTSALQHAVSADAYTRMCDFPIRNTKLGQVTSQTTNMRPLHNTVQQRIAQPRDWHHDALNEHRELSGMLQTCSTTWQAFQLLLTS